MGIKVVVFDFDGTLVDSNRLKDEAWFEVFAGHAQIKAPLIREVVAHNVGTRFDILRDIFVRIGMPQKETEQVVREYARRYDALVQRGVNRLGLVSGAKEALAELSSERYLYVNSATPTEPLRLSIKNLGIHTYFRDILGMPPTKEENLRIILGREGIEPMEAVVVGDGEGDLHAARSCGCKFVGIAGGYNSWQMVDFPLATSIRKVGQILSDL